MKIQLLIVLVLAMVLGGCANTTAFNAAEIANQQAEHEGSPFRWKAETVNGGVIMYQEMIPLPSGASKAGKMLEADTMSLINKAENTKERFTIELENVQHLPNGREVWVLKNDDGGLAYVVTYLPSAQGGTDIELMGPIQFKK